ncbi:oxidized low-density lipoprotein receptor 1-like [Hemitrygon akajei]|uniref:oxidized low-density lipoprotein receptor 1-like n=1 Tax=Hemitrygon akajei TaxID=2704970 RepID=UPI003BF96532
MDEGKTYVNVKFGETGPQSPSNDDMGSEGPRRRGRSDPTIWLICVLTATLIMTGICWRIHVSQIRQSNETCHRNSNLSDLKRMHNDLRHQFTEMETKYRSVNETKDQICGFLTSRREQTCSENWVTNKDRCYYVSTFVTSFYKAIQDCSNRDSRLLEINSKDEANFVTRNLVDQTRTYWIGKCENGKVASHVVYKMNSGKFEFTECKSTRRSSSCNRDKHRFNYETE